MATYDMKTLSIRDQRKMLFINISFHSTINQMTKFPLNQELDLQKTTSIADLRQKARDHQAALGLFDVE
jgi:hypothetical protein